MTACNFGHSYMTEEKVRLRSEGESGMVFWNEFG